MKFLEKIFTTIYNFIKKETAFCLFLTNIILCFIYILTSDPFGFFQRTYLNADPFFPFKKNEIDRIQIGRKGHETVLKKNKGTWSVEVREIETRSDLEKTFSFLNTILRIRKFTKISPITDPKKFGFNGEELKLEIQTESGIIGKLDIGTSENGTFVKEPDTGEIWIVEENLNSLLGRGNENFFLSGFLLPENIDTQEIHTILIYNSQNKNTKLEIEQTENGIWKPLSSVSSFCPGEDCSRIVDKIFSLKAERILKKPFEEKIIPLNSKKRFRIEIHFRSDQNSFLVLEWIGNSIHDEPVFRSDSDSILYLVDPEFLREFRETSENKFFFIEESDPIRAL
ncbi:DUF4340 domain-containing protein [Leptospira kirschneri]|uniref:PF14238 domain protein n=1 Tax=Leptospira kirschneri str. 200802841 TaxID=1193047 RepID=A0A828Y127_9LEPT|nr:DUF4340 domain-containing protein [Leptospira kirschneri]EKO51171.1 PF14238 domain protein [Leptospira kirschneri str. 200802841]EMK19411.1 PF14238 domain protein [Leptospira kirschneri serovar Bim str. PUO 1247]EMN03949.1 PF14238 domain protein [Leptospira kirschneri serovar Bim str. 1051]KON76197.1 PF14238 domain protein [Leptospira kirschneri serovar Mozdok]KPZ76176.1 hypothetical protein APS47_15680 [Leptospira kirschneri serovar Mozdok]